VVQIAADANASMAVAAGRAALWAWGRMPTSSVRAPRRVATVAALDGALVWLATCAKTHFVVVTSDGALWTWGRSKHGALGHGREITHVQHPCRIEGAPRCVAVAAARDRSAVVSEDGLPYHWGRFGPSVPRWYFLEILHEQTVGPFYALPAAHALVFAMGGHARLGAGAGGVSVCPLLGMLVELVELFVETARGGPQGRMAKLEGVMRLLGRGFRYSRGGTRPARPLPLAWGTRSAPAAGAAGPVPLP